MIASRNQKLLKRNRYLTKRVNKQNTVLTKILKDIHQLQKENHQLNDLIIEKNKKLFEYKNRLENEKYLKQGNKIDIKKLEDCIKLSKNYFGNSQYKY